MRPSLIVPFVLLTGACTVTVPEPDLEGQDVHLTVLHTADIHSRFFPYYFAPGQIDKGLGLIPKPGGDTAVVGGIGRISRVIKCVRGAYSDVDCDGITEDSVTKNPDGTLRCPNCKALAHIAGDPAARSVHLDSGDIFEGAPVFNLFQGEVEMRAMSEIGVSAMALGNHEFDKGSVDFELQKSKWGSFPILAANYIFTDPTDPNQPKLRDVIQNYTILDVNGLKLGVVGLGNLSSLTGIIEGGNTLGVIPIESQHAIVDAVQTVRPQVDILALVSHLGLDEDEGVASGAAEAQDQNAQVAVDGVDLIFGGHLHIVLDPPKDLPHINTTSGAVSGHTVLCHSGAFAKYVGRLDLVVHIPTYLEKQAGDKGSIKAYTYTLIPIDDSIASDPVMDNMLEPYLLKMNEFLNLGQVYADVACPVGQATCPKTQRNDPNGGDSQLGNLVATSMRLRQDVQADFGLTNSLGIRADFESGPLNLEEMYNVFPFDNTITTMFLSGDEVQQMLDFVAARAAERGCRTQAQVSGIYFDAHCNTDDPDCNARLGGPYPCAENIYLGDNCRMPDGTFNGTHCTPLEQFGEYRVAVNDYIAQGGSGFAVLKRNTTKFNTGISLRDSLVDYIRTLPSYEEDRCSPDVLAMKRTAVCDPTQNTNILGVFCKDKQGETYDCTPSCGCPTNACHSDVDCGVGGKCVFTSGCGADAPMGTCQRTDCNAFQACAGVSVQCGATDCTKQCCCHDELSGPERCSSACPAFQACMQQMMNPVVNNFTPQLYDFTESACLDQLVQSHDGRIQMFTGSGM